ncbi:MAG: hypothetical protein M1839_004806 [Geoglossum umbratile]|nr:MAG: hypothetical protein M1839_004806 [Geoglossum umbratile]
MTTNISIRSATFPSTYLRLDGRGITKFNNSGSGRVDCQSYVGSYEILKLDKHSDNTFGIRSATFANVYLRLDAEKFKKSSGKGGGNVNCQFGAADYENFRFVDQPDGSKAIESVHFPGVYLRMDGTPTPGAGNAKGNDNGLGVVNAERSIGPWEKFFVDEITTPLTRADIDTAIQKYGPVLKIHPEERYSLCSIDWYLTHCTLIDAKTGAKTPHPTASQLPQGMTDAKRYSLKVDIAAKPGDLSTAKAYVHAFWEQGMTVTDLQFWFFSAYNGPATAHVVGLSFDNPVHTGDPGLAPLGQHWADWEYVTLRIDNKTKELTAVYLSQHGTGHLTPKEDIQNTFQMADGTHPIIYASLNGHASFPSPGPNYMEYHKFPSPLAIPAGLEFSLHNDTADGGPIFPTSTNYVVVSAPFLTGADAYPDVPWVNYSYRWGPDGTVTMMAPDAIEKIVTAGFGDFAKLIPGDAILKLVGAIVPFFVKSDINGAIAPIVQSTWLGRY